MENQNQSDNLNKELSSIENNPDTIQNEILNNIDTQNTQYTEETNTEDLKTGKCTIRKSITKNTNRETERIFSKKSRAKHCIDLFIFL